MKLSTLVAPFLALAIGIAQMYVQLICWTYIATANPLPSWLLAHSARGILFSVAMFITDLAMNILLCTPVAVLLLKLRPRRLGLYLFLAAIPQLLWQYRLVLLGAPAQLGVSTYLPGVFSALVALPAAVLLVSVITARVASNNAFKPRPLRGSA